MHKFSTTKLELRMDCVKEFTLVLRANVNEYFFPVLTKCYRVAPVLRSSLKQESLLVRTLEKLNLGVGLLYNVWKVGLAEYNDIVIFDTGWRTGLTKYLKKKNSSCRVHIFFFNKIKTQLHQKMLADPYADFLWSFDPEDVKIYGLNYNSTFYTDQLQIVKFDPLWDIVFIGRSKGRTSAIIDLTEKFENLGLATKINLVEREEEFIDYNDYIDLVAQSRAILDVTSSNQTGLTLRFMEALFLRKKLITNNFHVRNYNFYKKENIFILGQDDWGTLKQFLYSEYLEVDSSIVEFYDFSNWLLRFHQLV